MQFKTMKPVLAAVLLIAALGTSPAWAKEPKVAIFVNPETYDVRSVLAPAPADSSAQTLSELAELHRIEASRTPEEAQAAIADASDESVFLFRTVLGPDFTAEKLPVVAKFFSRVLNDGSTFMNVGKVDWHRLRPGVVDGSLHPICEAKSESYPSGHSARGWLQGIILASMVPEKRPEILARSADYAYHRMVCGVHYRSDIEAGHAASAALAVLMLQNPAFQAELNDARAELRAAHLTAGR